MSGNGHIDTSADHMPHTSHNVITIVSGFRITSLRLSELVSSALSLMRWMSFEPIIRMSCDQSTFCQSSNTFHFKSKR